MHPINWFEIPALDLDRAQNFYETILALKLRRDKEANTDIAVFPFDRASGATGGALVAGPGIRPSRDGAIVYLDAGVIDEVLARVQAAGGDVLAPKTELPRNLGFVAQIGDTEGNRVGLHAVK
jgi:predicted enzyme related to lactoylglutathione lyase